MPQASAYTNLVRAYTEGRNHKIQYPGSIAQFNQLGALNCSTPTWWVSIQYKQACGNCRVISLK